MTNKDMKKKKPKCPDWCTGKDLTGAVCPACGKCTNFGSNGFEQ